MKKSSILYKSKFICIFLFFSLFGKSMEGQIISNNVPNESVLQAALKDFSGNDLTKKDGPLVKAGFDLALLFEEFNEHLNTNQPTVFKPSNSFLPVMGDKVIVDIVAAGDPAILESQLKKSGMQITGIAGPIISGLLPINSIEQIAGLKDVRFFHPSLCSTNIGATTSQGDTAQRSHIVKSSLGYDGTGVTVGVISDSYDYLSGASTDVSTGDLPGPGNPFGHTNPVNVIADDGTTDEGRAMLQIVHDVAPGANLAFATANGGQAAFANNITNLRNNAGANVIVDDVFYYAEPIFQDGVIAQAVDLAVAAGVPYFSSAGNQGQNSYESVWHSGPVLAYGAISGAVTFWGGTAFDFDPGTGTDYLQSFTLGAGRTIIIMLQWDSPFASVCTGCPGSQNDLDMYLLNSTGDYIYLSSAYNNIDGDAYEFIGATNTGSTTLTLNLLIVKYSGDDPGFIKYVNSGSPQGSLEFATNSSTIYGHANAAGAEAVAASAYFETPEFGVSPPMLEYYSSYGPTAIRFTTSGDPTSDPRTDKPEITAPDGVNTTFFGSDISQDADSYPNFFGTSAAAPHAAAVAALLLDANSSLTPVQIYSSMENSAEDMGTSGFDNGSGYGLVQADLAITGSKICMNINLMPDWNIFSIPVEADTMNTDDIFPNAVSPAYGYSDGYNVEDTLRTGKGYWIRNSISEEINICGYKVSNNIPVSPGWNLIGGYDMNIEVSTLTTSPGGILTSPFYGYNGGYYTADTLKKGVGYWIRSSEAGSININDALPKYTPDGIIATEKISEDWGRIIIRNGKGEERILYAIKGSCENLNRYDLPPIGPAEIFDVRYGSDRYAEVLGEKGEEVLVSQSSAPVNIRVEKMTIKIKDMINGNIINEYLKNGEEIQVTNPNLSKFWIEEVEMPMSYVLYRNYPNPFNPVTTIKFGLPEDVRVKLKIYNTLGEEVTELVNQEMEAGYHNIQFNAQNYASGVYFYRIETQKFNAVKKMVILK